VIAVVARVLHRQALQSVSRIFNNGNGELEMLIKKLICFAAVVTPMFCGADSLDRDIKSFKKALEGFEFNSGERYSEFKQGDRVAEFGLAALVAGGAAAVATKAGFWKVLAGSLAAFWKVIAAFCVAGWAGIRKFFSRNKAV
jgi:uncharacterized membrane-anchored protein